ncbi:MAG: hypothetical protein HQ464_13065 [Planctomycetes bacterium]|nr:hypothetical protein [Planctomycetota bacterium]
MRNVFRAVANHHRALALLVATMAGAYMTAPAKAQGLRGLIGDLARESAKIADDVPVRSIHDIVEEAGRSRAIRDTIEAEMRVGRELPQAARRSEAVLNLIRKSASIDPVTLRRIGELDGPAQDAALAITRGGSEIAIAVPDLAARSRMVAAGGPELLAAVGAREAKTAKEVALEAYRVQQAIEAGKVVSTTGKAVTVADFGRAVARHGDATIRFWDTYVKPHWGKWLAGGAITAYLVDPQSFQDAAGNLTEAGFRSLTVLVGDVTAAAIRGVGQGGGDAAHSVWNAIFDTFFTGPNRFYSIVGVLFIGMALILRFRRVRHWAGRPFRWLDQAPSDTDLNPPKP